MINWISCYIFSYTYIFSMLIMLVLLLIFVYILFSVEKIKFFFYFILFYKYKFMLEFIFCLFHLFLIPLFLVVSLMVNAMHSGRSPDLGILIYFETNYALWEYPIMLKSHSPSFIAATEHNLHKLSIYYYLNIYH